MCFVYFVVNSLSLAHGAVFTYRPMKAVILAAGKGTRMKELTNELPKPMLQVQGKPILEHILKESSPPAFARSSSSPASALR